jgi:hypothetical protein
MNKDGMVGTYERETALRRSLQHPLGQCFIAVTPLSTRLTISPTQPFVPTLLPLSPWLQAALLWFSDWYLSWPSRMAPHFKDEPEKPPKNSAKGQANVSRRPPSSTNVFWYPIFANTAWPSTPLRLIIGQLRNQQSTLLEITRCDISDGCTAICNSKRWLKICL